MSDELISINVWLASRSYRIRIRKDEEEAVRRSVKQADEKIAELRVHYAGKDDQDFIAMCLLMYASDHATDPLEHPASAGHECPLRPLQERQVAFLR